MKKYLLATMIIIQSVVWAFPCQAAETADPPIIYYSLMICIVILSASIVFYAYSKRKSKPHLPELLNAVNELSAWIILDNKFRIIRSNKEFLKLNGYDIKDISRLNPFPSIVFTNSYKEKKEIISCLAENHCWQGELSTIHKEGYIQTQLVKIQLVCSNDDFKQTFYMLSFVDITEQKKIEHQLRTLSEKDPLTGIWNRRKFDEELRNFCRLNDRYPDKTFGCLAIIDIDHFKLVNDELGHDTGDRVIQIIATTLKAFLRETDVIARVGGEEFAIILHHTTSEDAGYILNRIRKSIHSNSDIPCSISCGITNVTASPENVYKRADVALYDAKSTGRNKIITRLSADTSEIDTFEPHQFSARA